LSDLTSGTPKPICLKFWLGHSGDPRECAWLGLEILSWDLIAKIYFPGKIVQVLVNGRVTALGYLASYKYSKKYLFIISFF